MSEHDGDRIHNSNEFRDDYISDNASVLDAHHSYDFDFDAVCQSIDGEDPELTVAEQLAEVSETIHEAFWRITDASRTKAKARSFEAAGVRWGVEAHDLRKIGNPILSAFVARVEEWIKGLVQKRQNNQHDRSEVFKAGKCIIALIWSTNAEHFDGASLRGLAKEFGTTPPIISILSSDAAKRFGIVSRSHDSSMKAKVRAARKHRRIA
jgi:hypothetical protein